MPSTRCRVRETVARDDGLNASGRERRRIRKTDDERIRASLMRIIETGKPRQRLDATRELVALDQRSPGRPSRDFDRMTDAEIGWHFEKLAERTVAHWASDRLVPQLRALFEERGMAEVFDRAATIRP